MEPGKNADGYWGGQDVVKHLQNVIPLLQQIHPNCQLVFVFDNSSTHGCWPADALDANVLNLNPPPLEPRKRKAATSGLEPGEGAVAQPHCSQQRFEFRCAVLSYSGSFLTVRFLNAAGERIVQAMQFPVGHALVGKSKGATVNV